MFVFTATFAQKKYDADVTSPKITLEGKTLIGYATQFDFSREEVRKGWWKYAREFGSPLNMKTYYKVTIPSEGTNGNVDLELYSQTSDDVQGVSFFLGLESDTYRDQALTMLRDFKKKFYISSLIEEIESNQKESITLSSEYRNEVLESKQKELLSQIAALEQANELLREQIKAIEKS